MRSARIGIASLAAAALALGAGPCFARDIPFEVDYLFGGAEVIALFTAVKGNVTPQTVLKPQGEVSASFDFHVRPRVTLRVKQPLFGCRRGQVWDLPTPVQANSPTPWFLRDGQDVLACLRKEHGEYVAFYARPVVNGTLKLEVYESVGFYWATGRLPVNQVLNIVAGAVWRWHRVDRYDAPSKTTAQLVAELGQDGRIDRAIVNELAARGDAATLGGLMAKAPPSGWYEWAPLIAKPLASIPGAAPVPYLTSIATTASQRYGYYGGRDTALKALARPEAKAAVPALVDLLQRTELDPFGDELLSEIAKTLVAIGDPDGVAALMAKADELADPRQAAFIIGALAPSPDPRVGPFLVAHLRNVTVGEQDGVRVMTAAALALAKRGDEAGFARLAELRPPGVAEALGKLGDKRGVPVLLDILATADDYTTCEYAAEALARIGDDRAIGPLIEAAKWADPPARGTVVGAVATWDRPEVRAFLVEQLSSRDLASICAAAVGLSRFGLPQGADRLLALLEGGIADWSRFDRWRFYWALGAIKDIRAVPGLTAALRTDPYNRERIASALRGITGADLPSRPEPWQTWWRSKRADERRG